MFLKQYDNLNDKDSWKYASISMGLIFVLVGIPIWWKTTEVYRAELPYTDIEKLSANTVLSTEIVINLASTTQVDIEIIHEVFSHLQHTKKYEYLDVKYKFSKKLITQQDIESLQQSNYKTVIPINTLMIVFYKTSKISQPTITLSHYRAIIVAIPRMDKESIQNIVEPLTEILGDIVVNGEAIDNSLSKAYGQQRLFTKNKELHIKRTIHPSHAYDIVLTLLCPEPDKLQMSWNVQHLVRTYLRPMISKLGNLAEFNIGSQILYFSGVTVKPKKLNESESNSGFYLTHKQLSHVINPIESRLGSQISPNPTLNFVIYVTEERYRPLHIQKEDGTLSQTNTFLNPRWGAINIYNVDKQDNDSIDVPQKKLLDHTVMEKLIPQLRLLFGIEEPTLLSDVLVADPGDSAIRDWELDYLFRAKTFENIATSTNTLKSLADLLTKISNMVIKDEIANHLYTSVEAIKRSKQYLLIGDLEKALNYSHVAFRSSETAFFDPTLLELLYFPEDQKFAIYIPLFLPISLPLIMSFVGALKSYRKKQ